MTVCGEAAYRILVGSRRILVGSVGSPNMTIRSPYLSGFAASQWVRRMGATNLGGSRQVDNAHRVRRILVGSPSRLWGLFLLPRAG